VSKLLRDALTASLFAGTTVLAACADTPTAPTAVNSISSNATGPPAQISCGQTILSSIALANSLTDCAGSGIVIGADNIVVDGRGHTIDGTGSGSGVDLVGRSGVTVKNLRLTGFSIGINVSNSVDNRFAGNTLAFNNRGVRLAIASDNDIVDNKFDSNFLSIRVLWDADRNRVVRNIITNNASNAISLLSNEGNQVVRNTITGLGSHVVTLFDSDNNTIERNIVSGGIGDGIHLVGTSSGNVLRGKRVRNMGQDGLHLLESSSNNRLIGNRSTGNGSDGYQVDAGTSGNELLRNTAIENSAFGFKDYSTGAGTAGTASVYDLNHCRNNQAGGSLPADLCQ